MTFIHRASLDDGDVRMRSCMQVPGETHAGASGSCRKPSGRADGMARCRTATRVVLATVHVGNPFASAVPALDTAQPSDEVK
jgi:hypothetical protein